MPAISISGLLGENPAAREEALSASAAAPPGRFADRAAALADQKDDEIVAAVIVHAGDESVAAFDAVDEPVLAQEIERAINRDRRRTVSSAAKRSMIS